MMTPEILEILEILEICENEGVKLILDGDDLTVLSKKSTIDPDLLKRVKSQKSVFIEYFKKIDSSGVGAESIKITRYDRPERIPLSYGQERLWFLDGLQGSLEYHIPMVVRLEGDLDVGLLEASLRGIVDRHEVLRTNILSHDGVGYQEVVGSGDWHMDVVGLREEELASRLSEYIGTGFDLSRDYKLRCCLYELSGGGCVLACVLHHIASDGWSGGILVSEFVEFYASLAEGRSLELPEMVLQYADYALWQRGYLSGSVLESQLSYWEGHLSGVSPLMLATDYVRPPFQGIEGAGVSLELDVDLSASLSSMSKSEGVTLFMLLLSAFKVLLYRYSGQEDICVGTPIANRTQEELEGMIGFFVNTLALRSDLGGNPSFRDFLKGVKETTLSGYDHQLVPFEKVVERAVRTRDMGRSPLFQVMFVLQNTPEGEGGVSDLEGLRITPYEQVTVTSKFDLTLNVEEGSSGLSLYMEYSTSLFKPATIERMLSHYQELLRSIVSSPSSRIGDLGMLQAAEEEVLTGFNATQVDYPRDKTVVDLFESQARKSPDATAVVYEGTVLSYRELDARSNRLAGYLRDKGVEGETLVGLCIERSIEMLVGILGILKAGGAYVPIDPTYPEERITYMLEDGGIGLVLSSSASRSPLPTREGLEVVSLDGDWSSIAGYSSRELPRQASPSGLAYVIYTSGSTGRPKGVMVEHGNVVRLFENEGNLYDFSSTDVWTLFHSFCFDFSVWEIFGALFYGGRLVVVPEEVTKDAVRYMDLLVREGVTVLNQTPSFFYVLQGEFLGGDLGHCLRYVIFGGEALNPSYLRRWKEYYPMCKLINMYGITETTVHVTYKQLIEEDLLHSISTIGLAIPTTSCYIVDDNLNLLPIGVVGELCVGGAGVARGYLNRPDLTREKFIASPFTKGDRLYRTGDLARWLPDGTLEFIGRKDDQVKVRGYRIELGEIESVLSSLTGVVQSCVLAREDDSGLKSLVGYVVMEGDLDRGALEAGLSSRLPEYMVPRVWVELDEMPLTSNGKLDRRGLPDVDGSLLSRREYVAPRNAVEERLAGIWQELLGVDRVGVEDNFFELGGHSLLAVQLISRLHGAGMSIRVRDLFSGPTIGLLGKKVSSLEGSYVVPSNGITDGVARITPSMVPLLDMDQEELDAIVSKVSGGVGNIEDIYPLSPLQEGIHFHHLMVVEDQGDPYVLSTLLRFVSREKRDGFISALQFVVDRHDVLRTCVLWEGLSSPVQVVQREAVLEVGVLEVASGGDMELELQRLTAPGTQRMDIRRAPLLDLKVADDVNQGAWYLVVNRHHLMTDHVGIEKIIAEVLLYLSGRGSELAPPVLYREFIGHTLHSRSLDSGEGYFRSVFGALEEPTYPFGLSDVLGDGGGVRESSLLLSEGMSDRLRRASQSLGMSAAVLFHSAYGLLVGRCSNRGYGLFGSLFLGRLQGSLGASDSLGLFINTLPVLTSLEGSVPDYVLGVKAMLEGLLSYEQTPLSEIHSWSGIANEQALFSALLNYRHSGRVPASSERKGLDLGLEVVGEYERTNYPLTLSVDDYGDGFGMTVQVDGGLAPDRILGYMEVCLACILEGLGSGAQVSEIGILPEEELSELSGFNATQVDYPRDKTVVDLFESQARKSPDATAVVYEGTVLSYRELDARSNRLAGYLRDKGVEGETLVGLCIERSIEMLVGILGILKAGGAYVPIDPTYPEERITYMLEDGGIGLVLSSSASRSPLPTREGLEVVSLDGDWSSIAGYSSRELPRQASPSGLAYVIYTSGSTGRPKGVMVEHGHIVSLCTSCDYIPLDSDTVCLATGSISFDATTLEFWGTLLNGGRLIVSDTESLLDSKSLGGLLLRHGVTTLWMTASWFHQVVEQDLSVFDTLKYLLVGGDKVLRHFATKLKRHHPGLQLINGYGPTENTTFSTTYSITGEEEGELPIGTPLKNRSAYVLDSDLQLLPIGVVGELCVGGAGVARGYLNRPDLTREKFIASPFTKGDRLYRTGDLARWLPDGTLEFIGRKDDQVKVRGYRIELGEIESVLSSLTGVVQSCVLAREDDSGLKSLVGYVVMEGDLDRGALEAGLSSRLPEYMVPRVWVELDEMPLTSNGKLDRRGLPDVDGSLLSRREYVAPRNAVEERLAGIWQELLGVDRVGVEDNFFELGGHSLLATRLVSMVRKTLEVELSIREVFTHPTVSGLAVALSSGPQDILVPSITVYKDRPERIPLSYGQERLWFLDGLQGSLEYHIPMVVGSGDWHMDVVGLREEELASRLSEYIGTGFDLSRDYKLRCCLYELSGGGCVLACVLHHIASDGWSGGILVSEFVEFYASLAEGRSLELPEMVLQYADYALWQRGYLSGSVLESQLSYWEGHLSGVSPLMLATDYVRPPFQGIEGAGVSLELDVDLSASLSSMSKSEGVTLFMLLLSAFKVLLYRYSGQEDICVGTPIANRTQEELEGMIGFFVNTLALRSDLGGNPSFRDFLKGVKETTLSGYDHQLVPFEKVVERAVRTRDMGRSPLFQVMFVLQNTPEGEGGVSDLEGLRITPYEQVTVTSKFDLTLNVEEGSSGLSLYMEYSTSLFKPATIERMLSHYQELLRSIVSSPSSRIGDLGMLQAAEEEVLTGFNATQVDYPRDKTVVDLFESQARKSPDATAVVYEGTVLSYRELDARSNRLAGYLRDKGVEGETLVGLCIERSIEMLVGILGILKAGGAYVPIDPTYPEERITYMLEDGGIGLVLSSSASRSPLPTREGLEVVSLDGDWSSIAGYSSRELPRQASPSGLAYVIYTSGSTGRPKGVMVEHGSLVNFLWGMIDSIGMEGLRRLLSVTTYTFDIFYLEFFSPLLLGGDVIILRDAASQDGQALLSAIGEYDPDIMQATPSTWQMLLEAGWSNDSGIRVLAGGEAMSDSLKDRLTSLSNEVWNLYGPTEATIWATFERLQLSDKVTIGRPIANTQVYILDSDLNLLPIGVVGELCVGGAGVARGYLNRPDLTREKFIASPFTKGDRLYRTGDLARWLPDGTLEFIGRKDDQVKVRGYRIELGEIESVLSSLTGVVQSCVLAREDDSGLKSLVGYVVMEGDLDRGALEAGLSSRLPEYMVPRVWVELDEMPLTSNGKLDRRGLPDVDGSLLSRREYVAPRNAVEERLAGIWQELLGVDRVGVEDNFFELGGHSLLATRLVSMVRKTLEVELSIREVFTHPTVSGLAVALSSGPQDILVPSITVYKDRPERIPLSYGQERLWFLDGLQGSLEYHIPMVVRLEGDLDVGLLEASLRGIVDRHEVLRTNILSHDGVGYQEVVGSGDWHMDVVGLREEELASRLSEYIGTGFDLSRDYKLRCCLYELSGGGCVLACVLHHIASDGWSGGILVSEFVEFYASLAEGRSLELPEMVLQYADYALWQRGYLSGSVLESQLSYWEGHLSGVSPLMLATDYVRPPFQGIEGAGVSLELDVDLSASLSSMSKSEGVTLFMLLLSAFKVLLYRYSGQEDICVGTPIANRTQEELEGMIGFFVNTLALRSDLGGNPSFRDFLKGVKETTLSGYDHQLVPFEKVVERAVRTRDMGRSPLFQVMFVLQNTPEGEGGVSDLEGLRITPYEQVTVTSKFDLTLNVEEGSSGLSLYMEYSTSLFKPATIERMLSHYQELLRSIVSSPSSRIGDLGMLQAAEEEVLTGFNATQVDYPRDKTVVDLFESQARKSPDATAVVYEGTVLSYRELDARSNRLAGYLRDKGVEGETLVGLCIERSIEMLVGILGILKAGGAYVPIDPTYPEERITYMLEDGGIGLVLSSSASRSPLPTREGLEVVSLDGDWSSIAGYSSRKLPIQASPSGLAYVIYTSGSTGRPKGVMVEHGSLVNFLWGMIDSIGMEGLRRLLSVTTYTFDIFYLEFFSPLLLGGDVIILRDAASQDGQALLSAIGEYDPDIMQATPSTWQMLLEAGWSNDSGIRVLAGGEAMSDSLKDRLTSLSNEVWNLYGPTEATIWATFERLQLSDKVTIGRPIANTQVYILDSDLNLLPIGVVGELCVGGAGVARGYLNRPDLTREKFIASPFTKGDRLYRTGDLARWLPDGTLEFIGRKDDQVKVRGYRIELGEIESVLSSLTGVVQSCVLAREDDSGLKSLVGYVVMEGDLDRGALEAGLSSRLPEYMVPRVWVELDEMPLTSNGKLDRRGLPDVDGSLLSRREYVAPRNAVEERLAGIWQELLGVDRVGVEDNFFELGGHSLLATRLVSMVREKLSIELHVRNIFKFSTIEELSSYINYRLLDLNDNTNDYSVNIEI